jgi:hypothetical protein
MAEEKEVKKTEKKGLLEMACEAYGIAKQFLLSSKIYANGEVVLVTHGGAKVRWREGDKVEPLHSIRVTGINPEAKKRKPITGTGKVKEDKKPVKEGAV